MGNPKKILLLYYVFYTRVYKFSSIRNRLNKPCLVSVGQLFSTEHRSPVMNPDWDSCSTWPIVAVCHCTGLVVKKNSLLLFTNGKLGEENKQQTGVENMPCVTTFVQILIANLTAVMVIT